MASLGGSDTSPKGPLVSVVIPTYGRSEECSRAVASAIGQSLTPHEIIVVDDGSNPPVRLASTDSRVRLIRLPVNAGPSAARNRGVEAASGDWVAFLDSDDLWAETKLARQFVDHRVTEQVLLACNVTVKSMVGAHPYNTSVPEFPLDRWILVHRQSLQSSGLVAPRKLLLEHPFDERLRNFEDYDLVLRISRAGVPIDYISECLATYHELDREVDHPGSVATADLLPWLQSDKTPADPATRYHYYLIELFRRHLRESPFEALRVLAGFFNAVPNATKVSVHSISFALKRAILRRLQ